jgi:hypothetical protein
VFTGSILANGSASFGGNVLIGSTSAAGTERFGVTRDDGVTDGLHIIADFNRSGAAYMRWAYEAGGATLGVVYTLFNNSQNSTATFRNNGGQIQVNITGGAANYYVQVRIQGSQAA